MGFKRHQSTFDEKLSACIGLGLGLLLFGFGFWARQDIAHEQATMIETQGTVVDSVSRRERTDNGTKETYAPVIEFVVKNERLRFTGFYESYRLSNGRAVEVRYDPKDPIDSARIVEPLEGLAPWAAFGMAGATALSGLGALVPIRWSSEKQSS